MSDFIPLEIVERLSKQGLTEMEIVSQLKLRGFREEQINSALNEAIKQGVVGKPGIPARPHVDAGERDFDIPRRPERALQPPSQSSKQIEESAPLSKPPENIKLPEDLKPMELEDIGFPAVEKQPASPQTHQDFIEEAPIAPSAPKPIEQIQPSKPSPAPQPIQHEPQQLPPVQQTQPTRHPVQLPVMKARAPTPQHQAPMPKPIPVKPQTHQTPKPAPLPIKQKTHRREDITLEELVEEVVAGETEKIDKKITNILNKNTKTSDSMTAINKKITKLAKLTENRIAETDSKVNEVSSRIISMENRISALEEAFKSLGAVMERTSPVRPISHAPAHNPIRKHTPIHKTAKKK